jgi:outer membrane protein TolC
MRTALSIAAMLAGVAASLLQAQERQAPPVVTLVEARRRAAAVDPATVEARAGVSSAAWERRSALADLFTPNVRATTSYLKFSDPFFNFGTGDITSTATSATLEASYTLLGAGKLAQLRRSGASVASAEANETAARFRTALAADAAYYAVLAEGELSRVAAERLRRATEQLGVARVRVQAGETIATDSLQLLLEVNRARLEVLRRDSALAVSRLRLGRRIGWTGPVEAAPLDSAPPPPLPVTLETATAELGRQGPEVEAARAAERQAGAGLASEREGYLPDITLNATIGAYDSEFFPSALKRNQFGVTVSLPIWDGGRREVSVARARAQRDVARALREERERATAEDMAQAFNGYETARAGIELAVVGVSVSAENYRVQGARYREGATTILDLLEAQVALSGAEATLVQARYSARLALAQIEALLGRRLFAEQDQGDRP